MGDLVYIVCMRKKRIGLLFGGRSAEHEVSVISARSIVSAVDRSRYDLTLIGIDQDGAWHVVDEPYLHTHDRVEQSATNVAIIPGQGIRAIENGTSLRPIAVDVVFPALHGPFGEDGTVQGALAISGLPYVGAGVLGSAVGMDKEAMKRLLHESGLPIGKYLVRHNVDHIDYQSIKRELGELMFIKPANLGSSVGINKACNKTEFERAVADAFQYDRKIVIEEAIVGRELECAVLGNDELRVASPGEIIPKRDFYSYDAKYLDEDGAELVVPADIDAKTSATMQEMAIQAFRSLFCSGLARIDFFLKPNGEIIINEINTLPGFTPISMYPKMWSADGLNYPNLINRLLELAVENFSSN